MFPRIQPEPPLAHLEAILSSPQTMYFLPWRAYSLSIRHDKRTVYRKVHRNVPRRTETMGFYVESLTGSSLLCPLQMWSSSYPTHLMPGQCHCICGVKGLCILQSGYFCIATQVLDWWKLSNRQILATIYQRSWVSGEVHADWKTANFIPMYKKGMREGPGKYRPVSRTSVCGKVL